MKIAYPIIITKGKKYLIVSIPDCEIDTQGETIVDAIDMARDAISLWCVGQQDAGRPLPPPSEITALKHNKDDILSLVDVDIDSYRRKLDNRTVRKNLTVPSWLCEQAEEVGINFSGVLQEALKQKLGYKNDA
ncbi:MAG: type II toxin-antitoxin system HicB family antitoxin [Oscillospiraceae bacterium]|nr:type II toxin-antitoxin system HicB family antitoxin [Oscillospiraceae bacterium]